MSNIIRLKLSKIKYTGDSIGDDIRVSGKVFEKQFVLDEQIRRGESVFLDTEIGKIEIDQDIYTFQITLQVTEKDLVFDDVGSVTKAVTVNLNTTKSQSITLLVEVRESRGLPGRKKALFEITLETLVEASSKTNFANKSIEWWMRWKELKPYTYRGINGKEDYNRYDSQIKQIVAKWNKEFCDDTFPPDEPLDPNLVKAIVFQESRMGYDKTAGINVMQVGKAHDPSIKTIRGELKEYWVHDGKLQRLKYDARVTNIEESIKWGTRWLYHKARENVPGLKQAWKQIWKTWYVAVKEYGPGPESYAKSVWRIYTEGIKKEKDLTITLWSWNFLTILLAALMFFQPAPPQPTLSDIITREMSPEERLYIDDIETGYASDGSLFWAIVATNKDWWEEIKVGRNVNHGIQWLPMKEVPDEQSILKARFLKLRGFPNPILEVYGKTHVGNGAIHLYEVGQSEVKLLLEVPYSVDSYYDDVWLPENNEKYGHYNCGDVIRGDALDSKYVDLNNDGVDDLILSGVRDMFCDTESSDKNKEPGLVKVDERRIEEQFVWNPAAGHYEMNESK